MNELSHRNDDVQVSYITNVIIYAWNIQVSYKTQMTGQSVAMILIVETESMWLQECFCIQIPHAVMLASELSPCGFPESDYSCRDGSDYSSDDKKTNDAQADDESIDNTGVKLTYYLLVHKVYLCTVEQFCEDQDSDEVSENEIRSKEIIAQGIANAGYNHAV